MDPLSIGNEAIAARQSILGSFLRSRPRGASQSHPSPPAFGESAAPRDSPPPALPSSDPSSGHRRRAAAPNIQTSTSQSNIAPAFTQMLRRRRSAGTLATTATPQAPAVAAARTTGGASVSAPGVPAPAFQTHRIRLVPHLASRTSLRFDPICRDVREGDPPLRIGRFTDRSGLGLAAANALGSNKLAFKSKVVSRAHAEIWVEGGGRFLIKDTKSSSGTFLNHVRLSPAGTESRPNELRDGDLLQLGVDYQGGNEDIYKCVKIKIEMGREWQAHANPFNANALKQLKAIAVPQGLTEKKVAPKSALPDCCICLFAVTINQALFIAPCSHAFHYKCIRPLLETHHPAFSCPLCRTFANLEEDVEVEIEGEVDTDSVEGISAALPSSAAIAPLPERPNTGDSGSRERERERDRDAGAETEVEVDTRLGMMSRGRRPSTGANGNMFLMPQDAMSVVDDVEMEDVAALPPLPEGSPLMMPQQWSEVEHVVARDASVSPVPMSAPNVAMGDVSEFEGDGSGEGMSDEASGSGDVGDAAHGKRKR
ncbi:SMAD/FHA domain-containing protein [Laetiporus sulphureus 93-53]|uniref:SMAD/FHA domain-containing protein n=1 Tax=Laetiporus sulphureus 93-53 TaxID=1314785 RepID=A0A165CXC7_9APHY|nr:SMAD/FHA domain-containing protein [Laetiporus sulphureus 93-53]KZT03660.1 SMAD/FHA domain-containing protein [Laetiporus sulphureus 93-53]